MRSISLSCLFVGLALVSALFSGCGTASEVAAGPSTYSGTKEGARALLTALAAPGADGMALTKALQPTSKDYDDVFVGDAATKVRDGAAALWATPVAIGPKEGQTELRLWSATTEELRAGTGESAEFPGGYAGMADKLEPGLTFYRFKFVPPGADTGMAFDGLVHVNGQWRFFPKPWRYLE